MDNCELGARGNNKPPRAKNLVLKYNVSICYFMTSNDD